MKKIGRNDACPCGSGRKYKHCCYLDDEKNAKLLRAAARAQKYDDVAKILNEQPRTFRLEARLESLRLERFDSTISRTIEVLEIYENGDPAALFPRLVASIGEAPAQYERNT